MYLYRRENYLKRQILNDQSNSASLKISQIVIVFFMMLCKYTITYVVILPKMFNLNLIMRKHSYKYSLYYFYKITVLTCFKWFSWTLNQLKTITKDHYQNNQGHLKWLVQQIIFYTYLHFKVVIIILWLYRRKFMFIGNTQCC